MELFWTGIILFLTGILFAMTYKLKLRAYLYRGVDNMNDIANKVRYRRFMGIGNYVASAGVVLNILGLLMVS